MTPDACAPELHLLPRLTLEQVIERFPEFVAAFADEDDLEYYEDCEIVLLEGNFTVDENWLAPLPVGAYLVVDGHLKVNGRPRQLLYVSGDLHCTFINISGGPPVIGGRLFASGYVNLSAEDDGITRDDVVSLRIVTPLLFVWFYEVNRLEISPDTVIFIVADGDYCDELNLPNPIFAWHEGIHALRPELQSLVYWSGYDGACWDLESIRKAWVAGDSILREGFDTAALPDCADAAAAGKMNDLRTAFLFYKRAAQVAPAYHRAWLGMANTLWNAGACEQALPHYLRAASLFPERQYGLPNEGLNGAALCAIRCRQWPQAIDLATRSITHNEHADHETAYRAQAYRLRAEARLLSGDMIGAQADLESALTFNAGHGTANWLMGLIHHLNGDAPKAQAAQRRAAQVRKEFNHPYGRSATSTDFLSPPATTVDWDDLPINSLLPVKDEAYWCQYVANEPMWLARVPMDMRTQALCEGLVASAGTEPARFSAFIPEAVFTADMAVSLARKCSANLQWIPSRLMHSALCRQTPEDDKFCLKHVPEALHDRNLCLHAVRCGASLEDVPPDLIDREMCEAAVKRHCYQIEHAPATYLDEALYVLAMAHADPYFVDNHAPSIYKSTATLRKVIEQSFTALDAVPGKLFNAELFAHAQSLYGSHPDWPEILARHGQAACRERGHCAEKCWLVFWDEPFMLKQIRHPKYHLGPYEIPRSHFTESIAKACFKRDPIHLASIPVEFVTSAMCKRFIREYADHLADVPVKFRDRSVCVTALIEKADQSVLVPAGIHAAVFDELFTRHRDDFDMGWLLVERGRGQLMAQPPRLQAAAADFTAALQGQGEEYSQQHKAEADFLLGYCKHLGGDLAEATQHLLASGHKVTYDALDLTADKQTADFDRPRFDELMRESGRMGESGDWNNAYANVLAAELLLKNAGVSSPVSWAFVFDHKRWISYELALWDVNEATCHEAIERLEKLTLWDYVQSDNVIRHTLRACYNRLGARVLDADAPSLTELQTGLQWVERAFALKGAAEDDSVHDEFHQFRAALLLALTELDPSFMPRRDKALEAIERLKLRAKGHMGLESVIDALDARMK